MKRRPPDALDDPDKAIVELLQEDGRRSYTGIAAAVGLSEAAVRTRVQRLIEGNVVQIVGVTDPLRLGFRRQAMVGVKTEGDIEAVADTLAAIPEVDYVVFVVRLLRPALRDRVRGRRAPAVDPQRQDPEHPRRAHHRHLHVPATAQADVRVGNALTASTLC